MSLRADVEELVKWMADLTASDEAAPTLATPPPEAWQHASGDLERASQKVTEAAALLAKQGAPYLAEFARDVAREAEDLALRAHMLSRRAKRTPKPAARSPKTPAAPEEAAASTRDPEATAAAAAGKRERRVAPAKSPEGLVHSASDTVETALGRLNSDEAPDAITTGFEYELDVLAEMALSLRQQCTRLEEKRRSAPTRAGVADGKEAQAAEPVQGRRADG